MSLSRDIVRAPQVTKCRAGRSMDVVAALILLVSSPFCIGQVIYQSASLTQIQQAGGVLVALNSSGAQYLGVRFQLGSPTTITSIGGDFGIFSGVGNNELFGAIISLPSLDAFPLSAAPLNTPDVLAITTFMPSDPGADVSAPIGPLALAAGDYALLFGSGQFGATGQGFAPPGNSPVGSPSYIVYAGTQTSGQWETFVPSEGLRFFVGAPEPSSCALLCITLGLTLARRRSTSSHHAESPCTPSKSTPS